MTRKTTPPATKASTADLVPATERDLKEGDAAARRCLNRRPTVPLKVDLAENGNLKIGALIDNESVFTARLRDTCGTNSSAWTSLITNQLVNAGNEGRTSEGPAALKAGLAFLNGLAPTNEIEAALGAQMFGAHMMAMTAARRTEKAELADLLKLHADLANKAMRTFTVQLEALAKLRGGGKQQVEVRHVYVNGNAVIGDVHAAPQGGGPGGSGDQPQAPELPYAPSEPVPPLWGEDQSRHTVPIAGCERAQALPDARRRSRERRAQRPGERPISARNEDQKGDGDAASPSSAPGDRKSPHQ